METRSVRIPVDHGENLEGELALPASARGLVLFAHGSGSSRLSPRNRQTAAYLQSQGLGTLLFDLLTGAEGTDPALIFDIPFLASRLVRAARWARGQPGCEELPFGFFGASTGGGAAIWAASEMPEVSAVVSRGGRPDLAAARLPSVKTPVLLLVGGEDRVVLALNRQVLSGLERARLVVVSDAGHLFEEPGAMEEVEQESAAWFLDHFRTRDREVA